MLNLIERKAFPFDYCEFCLYCDECFMADDDDEFGDGLDDDCQYFLDAESGDTDNKEDYSAFLEAWFECVEEGYYEEYLHTFD